MKLYDEAPDSLEFKQAFLRSAIFWFLIFEGVWFWINLLGPIQQLARLGVFKNTAEQFAFILKDEISHVRFGVELIREFMLQYPEAMSEEMLNIVQTDILHAIDLEAQFISYCLKDGPIIGYSAHDHVETAKFFSNLRMKSIGLPEIYHGAKHMFPWMSEQMELKKEASFFEVRNKEYQTGGALKWDDDDDNE
jgi:ribonucleoside-diphosphate reductase beta chain